MCYHKGWSKARRQRKQKPPHAHRKMPPLSQRNKPLQSTRQTGVSQHRNSKTGPSCPLCMHQPDQSRLVHDPPYGSVAQTSRVSAPKPWPHTGAPMCSSPYILLHRAIVQISGVRYVVASYGRPCLSQALGQSKPNEGRASWISAALCVDIQAGSNTTSSWRPCCGAPHIGVPPLAGLTPQPLPRGVSWHKVPL